MVIIHKLTETERMDIASSCNSRSIPNENQRIFLTLAILFTHNICRSFVVFSACLFTLLVTYYTHFICNANNETKLFSNLGREKNR